MTYKYDFEFCTMIMLFIFTLLVYITNPLRTKQNMSYILASLLITMSSLFDVCASITANMAAAGFFIPPWFQYTINVMYFLMVGIDGFYYCIYLINMIGEEKYKKSFLFKLMTLPMLIYSVIVLFTPINKLIFYIDKSGYHQGPLNTISIIVPSIYVIIGLGFIFAQKKKLTKLQIVSGVIFCMSSSIGMVIQTLFLPNVLLGFATASIAVIIVYFSLQTPDSYELIKTIAELETAKKNAENASKAKEYFLANMSHEIRTPINIILGMNEMITAKCNDKELLDYSAKIAGAGSSLLTIINDILDYTKMDSSKMKIFEEPYSVAPMLNDLIVTAELKIDMKPIKLITDIDENIPSRLIGDQVRIKQVISNILVNAVKYTKCGSVIFTVGYEKTEDGRAELSVSVKDTGIGISEENMKHLFESFMRFDENKNNSVEGTGLGLAITKQLLELMGSTIEVESKYGIGSVFSFRLVQSIDDPEPIGKLGGKIEQSFIKAESVRRSKPQLIAPSANVLIVDDNEMNLYVIKKLLERTRIAVDTASGGAQCLKAVTQKKYDIIFLDHMMPEMSGVEVFEKLKTLECNLSSHARIIALTANAVLGAKDEYISIGFDDYVSKPVGYDMLEAQLIKHLPPSLIKSEQRDEQTDNAPEQTEKNTVLNAAMGREYSGGEDTVYCKMLSMFSEQYEKNLPLLSEYIKNGDMSNYAISVHAIKSTSLNIGAATLSSIAKEQEAFAKEGDTVAVTQRHEKLLAEYSRTVNAAKKYLLNNEQHSADDSSLIRLERNVFVNEIKAAIAEIEVYDNDEATLRLRKLEKCRCGDCLGSEVVCDALKALDIFDNEGAKRSLTEKLDSRLVKDRP